MTEIGVLSQVTGGSSVHIVNVTGTEELQLAGINRAYSPEVYDGEYEITPGDSAQVLQTAGLVMTGNVTVKAIPGTPADNWGRITWDGSKLTVS